MRVITIDFETYFSTEKKYSLKKMGPVEYIRDRRFKVICVGYRINQGDVYVVPEDTDGSDAPIAQALQELKLDEPGTITVGHNIAGFDAVVLSEHFGIKPHCIVDTIPMMHWLGLSRVGSCSHKALTELLGHGIKQAGTVVSDGKMLPFEFTQQEWDFFLDYCMDDVQQCSENFYTMLKAMGPQNAHALVLMDLTAKMATQPAFIPDGKMLEAYVKELDAKTEQAREKLATFLHFHSASEMLKAVRSRLAFPKLLEQTGTACPMKWSEKQGKNIPAISKTDLEFTALLNSPNKNTALLVQTRLEQNSSIQRSRAVKLLSLRDKPIPIMLSALKAHTGRYTAGGEGEQSDGLNFQNFSKRDPNQLVLRKSLKVAPGYKVVACDSSQIEARMLAYEAEQTDLVEQFRNDADPYSELASKIFNVPAQDIHNAAKHGDDPNHDTYKKYRNVGKTSILSSGYGCGWQKYSDTLLRQGVSLDKDIQVHEQIAQLAHATYRQSNYMIVRFWKTCDGVLRHLLLGGNGVFGIHGVFKYGWMNIPCTEFKSAYIELPNGYRLWYPGLRAEGDACFYNRYKANSLLKTKIYGASCVENITQALAFALLAWQAENIVAHGVQLHCNIHDAWIAVVPEAKAEETKKIMETCMSQVPAWLPDFPVACEAEVGDDFTIA